MSTLHYLLFQLTLRGAIAPTTRNGERLAYRVHTLLLERLHRLVPVYELTGRKREPGTAFHYWDMRIGIIADGITEQDVRNALADLKGCEVFSCKNIAEVSMGRSSKRDLDQPLTPEEEKKLNHACESRLSYATDRSRDPFRKHKPLR